MSAGRKLGREQNGGSAGGHGKRIQHLPFIYSQPHFPKKAILRINLQAVKQSVPFHWHISFVSSFHLSLSTIIHNDYY